MEKAIPIRAPNWSDLVFHNQSNSIGGGSPKQCELEADETSVPLTPASIVSCFAEFSSRVFTAPYQSRSSIRW